jgi:hypothetical protein
MAFFPYSVGCPSIRTSRICVRPITSLFEVGFYKYFTERSPYWDDMSPTFWLLPWRSRSQHDLAAKLFQAHNFVIWSRILQLFHRNDHHIEKTCRAQHLGRYLKGQGHSMTLQQNRVQPITLLFKVGFNNYFTEMINILRRRVACKSVDRSHWLEMQCKEQ